MAARSRPRGGQMKDEYDEERSIWNGIKSEGRNIDQLMVGQTPRSFQAQLRSCQVMLQTLDLINLAGAVRECT